jgi:hypothetical protein
MVFSRPVIPGGLVLSGVDGQSRFDLELDRTKTLADEPPWI